MVQLKVSSLVLKNRRVSTKMSNNRVGRLEMCYIVQLIIFVK